MSGDCLALRIDALVRSSLSAARYRHSLRAAELAEGLCARFHADPWKGYACGLGHDAAREASTEEILRLCRLDGLPIAPAEEEDPLLLHGRASAMLVAREAGCGDAEILQAIRDHVTGRPSMGTLSRILFAADYLEPGRTFLPGDFVRDTLALDLDAMTLAVLKGKIQYVRAESKPVSRSSLILLEELEKNAR
jgi:predicted HD superfamily hydrolase involved in NAD metabolism